MKTGIEYSPTGEIWKDVAGYEGMYKVSTLGNISTCYYRCPMKTKSKLIIKGYYSVLLSINSIKKRWLVHRIVAVAFIENKDNKPHVNHKDGNKLNNRADNLEWVTPKENMVHAHNIGLFERRRLLSLGRKLTVEHIMKIKAAAKNKVPMGKYINGVVVETYPSIGECSNKTGINRKNILTRKTPKKYGYELKRL